ncbi:MAG: selenium metabolism protein SsnA [Clostridiales bacterium]|jgi:putative selenium metabolism protein SsnA|nr:selenium metabolism protein SsnA [Clostridiales bacterium]
MILIGNGNVITRDNNNTYLENGAICIENQFIYDIGSLKELQIRYPEAEFIDAHGGLIMPGYINTHNHIYSALARGLSIPGNNPSNFLEILQGTWWKLDLELTMKQIALSAKITFLDCIRNGVTTVFDHHASYGNIKGSLFKVAEIAKEMGVRTCLSYEISDRDGLDKMKQSVSENIEFLEYANHDQTDMIKAMIGMHASFTLSDETLEYCVNLNKENGGYHIHVAEGISDAIHCKDTYQMSIVERLYKKGILGKKTIAAHCIHIDDSDRNRLLETGTMVVHNPESNMGNAVGCSDVLALYKKGILIGLGTDGYTNDMLESMKVANLLQKHNSENPSAAWTEIPTMLFMNNKKIAERFYNNPLGIIEKGAYADIIISDYQPFTPMNSTNMNSHILFGMNGRNTITTIINGKVRMKDRKFTVIEDTEILLECREEANHLWKALGGE